ncbi:efflux transporter periplasmic adaptor subunit [Roseovarius sp. HI0049]|nr:efflux transporter periplasmic adaptor subunit [Roseovarius sp. HI0049]
MRRILTALLLAAALPVATYAQQSDRLPLAKLIPVEAGDASVTRKLFGHVAAKETVDLAFQVGGQVVRLPVVEGNPITEGDLIAQLDLEPFELSLEQARVEKQQADRTLERLRKLEGNAVSQVSVEDAETQANLAGIAVRNAERSLEEATLEAPFDGLVARRMVANFASVSAGTPVVRLHDLSELRVEIDVPEVLFQQAGRDPDIELFATFPASDERFDLTVREFNAETSDIGQTFRITLAMPPPDDLIVLPGSSVEVTATLRKPGAAITIPKSAVVMSNDGQPYVMLFTPDDDAAAAGTVARTPVTVEPTNTGRVRVLGGIEEGQEIVASGAAGLKDGDRVARFGTFPE